VPTDDNPPAQAPAEPNVLPQADPSPARTVWDWMQVVGLLLLAAGVAVLVVFALTLGGH
jgi:uncharacterized membrane protein HdeD (DUF308 family)